MVAAGRTAYLAFLERDERYTTHDLIAHVYEQMIEAAIVEK